MQALENRRFARDVIADRGLYPRHVVRVHQGAPIRRLTHIVLIVAEHGLPARRQIDPVVQGIEIPQPVVGAVDGKFVALFQILEVTLNIDALKSGRQT